MISTSSYGDILAAAPNGTGGYQLESNQVCGNRTATPLDKDKKDTPSQAQFYWADGGNRVAATLSHHEASWGGVAQTMLEDVVFTALTPANALAGDQTSSGGVLWLDNISGGSAKGYNSYYGSDNVVYDPPLYPFGRFSKANGLGDVESLSKPAPIEIGNRVWMDTDNDGVQDAGEMGIGGVTVKLYKSGAQVAQTTTAGDGTYYFNNANVTMNGATGIVPEMAYELRIDAADFPAGKILSTHQNAGGAGQPDVRDNDAVLSGGNAVISFTAGKAGENNHTLDFAFSACAPVACGSSTITKN